jgi:hypothetical protein
MLTRVSTKMASGRGVKGGNLEDGDGRFRDGEAVEEQVLDEGALVALALDLDECGDRTGSMFRRKAGGELGKNVLGGQGLGCGVVGRDGMGWPKPHGATRT